MLKIFKPKFYFTLGFVTIIILFLLYVIDLNNNFEYSKKVNKQLVERNKKLEENIFAVGGMGLKPEEAEDALEVAKQYKSRHDITKYKWKYKELAKPIENGYITSETGVRRINGILENVKSTDWKAEMNISVNGGFFGKVKEVGYSDIYGNYIIIQGLVKMELIKDKPEIVKIEMRYSHLSQVFVIEGEYIQKGQEIAYIGNSGRCATWDNKKGIWRTITEYERGQGRGTHLDIELRVNGYLRNPFANSTFGKQVRL